MSDRMIEWVQLACAVAMLALVWWRYRPRPPQPYRSRWVSAQIMCAACSHRWAEVFHEDCPGTFVCSACGFTGNRPSPLTTEPTDAR